jgi:hypothetical protein
LKKKKMVNLFWLHPACRTAGGSLDYSSSARSHIDAHITKIPVEAAQLMYGAHHSHPTAEGWIESAPRRLSGDRGYKPVHMRNPLRLWISENAHHYRHVAAYAMALCREYTHRYGRVHACEEHVRWLAGHEPAIPDPGCITRDPPLAMPDAFKVKPSRRAHGADDEWGAHVYLSYRAYYCGAKLELRRSEWTKRERPAWLPIIITIPAVASGEPVEDATGGNKGTPNRNVSSLGPKSSRKRMREPASKGKSPQPTKRQRVVLVV